MGVLVQVALCMGPWAVVAEEWFGLRVPMVGIKSSSMIYTGCDDTDAVWLRRCTSPWQRKIIMIHIHEHHGGSIRSVCTIGFSTQSFLAVEPGALGILASPWQHTRATFTPFPFRLQEPYALFCSEDSNGCHLEVYPRPNGDVYLCGLGGSDHVKGDRLREKGDCGAPEKIQVRKEKEMFCAW